MKILQQQQYQMEKKHSSRFLVAFTNVKGKNNLRKRQERERERWRENSPAAKTTENVSDVKFQIQLSRVRRKER